MNAIEASHRSMIRGWADPHKDVCLCHGSGWILSSWDVWGKCRFHYHGQPHPEDYNPYEHDPELQNWTVCLSDPEYNGAWVTPLHQIVENEYEDGELPF